MFDRGEADVDGLRSDLKAVGTVVLPFAVCAIAAVLGRWLLVLNALAGLVVIVPPVLGAAVKMRRDFRASASITPLNFVTVLIGSLLCVVAVFLGLGTALGGPIDISSMIGSAVIFYNCLGWKVILNLAIKRLGRG